MRIQPDNPSTAVPDNNAKIEVSNHKETKGDEIQRILNHYKIMIAGHNETADDIGHNMPENIVEQFTSADSIVGHNIEYNIAEEQKSDNSIQHYTPEEIAFLLRSIR